jgi:molybdopterin-guanine dinucleotide biosynthesis protein A
MGDAIVLLAGGQARRFPGKLEHVIDGRPMLVNLFEHLQGHGWPVYVAGKGSFSAPVDAAITAPLLIDRWPPGGPMNALLSACAAIPALRVFAIAADLPRFDAWVLERLTAAWQPGDEAAVPQHAGGVEPLAALYERSALLREGAKLRRTGRAAMWELLESLRVRFVPIDDRYFRNVNSVADLPAEGRTA